MFKKQDGFTLAEVLIALALLGVVAAFAIPKVLQSTQNNEKNAIFQEGVATVSQLYYEGGLQGQTKATFGTYFKSNLNALTCVESPQVCFPGNGLAVCAKWDCTMANGATYTYSNHGSYDDFVIDYDGLTHGPNTDLQDRLYLWGNFQATPWCGINRNAVGQPGTSSAPGCDFDTGPWTSVEMAAFYKEVMGIN